MWWLLVGIGSNPYTWLIAVAVLPAVFLLVRVYKADRLEPEPKGLLLSLLGLGVVSTFPAAFLEGVGEELLFASSVSWDAYNFWLYFGVVALSEEGLKYLFMKLRTWRSPHFDCRFDGIVYAVFVSLGFALAENISYALQYGMQTALLRAVTSIPGHASFGVFMGVYYGAAKKWQQYGRPALQRFYLLLSLLVPVALHGAYDFLASSDDEASVLGFIVFVIVMFLLANRAVKRGSRQDEFIQTREYY